MKLRHRRTIACLIVSAALSGCAAPQTRVPTVSSTEYAEEALNQLEFALKREVRDEVRLWNVGTPILVGAAELCEGKVRPYTGLWVFNLWNFGALYQNAARKLYGLDQNLRVAHMLPGSPAAEAGLIAGDIVLSAGGLAIPRGEGARDRFYQILETYGRAGSPIEIKASRGGQTLAFRVVPGTPQRVPAEGCSNATTFPFGMSRSKRSRTPSMETSRIWQV